MKKLIAIYRSKKKEGLYVFLEKDVPVDTLPEAVKVRSGKLEQSMVLVLTRDKKLARTDGATVLDAIDLQGFYLQMPPQYERYMQNIPNDKLPAQRPK